MRVLAGGAQEDDKVYVDAEPRKDRTLAPEDEVKRFLAANTFMCQWLRARITKEQCGINRARNLYYCSSCTEQSQVPEARISRRGRPRSKSPWHANPRCIPQKVRERTFQKIEAQGPRAKSQEPRAKSQEPRVKSQEPRAKSQEPRAKSQEPRAKSQDMAVNEILRIMVWKHQSQQAAAILKGRPHDATDHPAPGDRRLFVFIRWVAYR